MTVIISGSGGITSVDGSAAAPSVTGTDTDTGIVYGTNTLSLSTGGTTRATVDSSGNLGLGVTPSAWGGSFKAFQIVSGGTSLWSDGSVAFYNRNTFYDGTNRKYVVNGSAQEYAQLNDGSHAWKIAASGTAGNAITFTTAMTLDSSGKFQVNSPSFTSGMISVKAKTSTAGMEVGIFNNGDNAINWYNASNTYVCSVVVNSASVAYNTSSDYRLKDDIQLMTGALAKVSSLKPVTWKWKSDGSDGQGFIAHEVADIVPQAVSGEKDAVDEEGNPKYQGIDTSFLVATLTAAIQEQQALITQLTERITALEAK